MLYSTSCGISPLVILAKMKHHFVMLSTILEVGAQSLERKDLDPYGLK